MDAARLPNPLWDSYRTVLADSPTTAAGWAAARLVVWTSNLLAQLSDRQWEDAFRSGSYEPAVANRFIRKVRGKVAE